MKFEVTLRLPDAEACPADLPQCRDAVLARGRAGFVLAMFEKDGTHQGFEVQCALTDLKWVLPDAVATRIEFIA